MKKAGRASILEKITATVTAVCMWQGVLLALKAAVFKFYDTEKRGKQ